MFSICNPPSESINISVSMVIPAVPNVVGIRRDKRREGGDKGE
jgi:hypothetical protein